MLSNLSSSSPHERQRQPLQQGNEHDQAVKSTADDAIIAKLSCVEKGYYEDPFIRAMAQGASGLVTKKSSASRQSRHPFHNDSSSTTEPIIRKGTHARVKAVDRAIDAFLSLPLSSASPDTKEQTVFKQVVVLGAGRDTTYLRYRFGKDAILLDDKENVRWYEVDHPSIIQQKAHSWLPSCIPDGYDYNCDMNEDTSGNNSYAITIAAQEGEKHDERSMSMMPNYHLIGHDLRSSPASLFETLTHPKHGYDRSMPTLFVLECVMMYLPNEASSDLLRHLAESPLPCSKSSCDPFVAVVIYDPIPSNDRFGQLMIENLQRAGITGRKERSADDDAPSQQLSLEKTRTLSDQLTKLAQSGFDIAVGCDMMNAYDHGVISMDDRRRAARCEMLDELEEFNLLMKHYCLVVGVSSKGGRCKGNAAAENRSTGFQLCSVGEGSLMGFQEGRCTVVNR